MYNHPSIDKGNSGATKDIGLRKITDNPKRPINAVKVPTVLLETVTIVFWVKIRLRNLRIYFTS